LLDENGIGVLMFLEEKIEGRKVQSLPFLLSKNMRKYTLKNTGFCPNKVIHFIVKIKPEFSTFPLTYTKR